MKKPSPSQGTTDRIETDHPKKDQDDSSGKNARKKSLSPARKKDRKKIQQFQTVLDDLVSVNSLFTFAMFIGISFASANPHSLELRKECQTGQQTRMLLLFDEVVSFVCFLLSSIVATALKVHLSTYDINHNRKYCELLMDGLRSFMITVSVASSVLGCVYLTLSMFNVVRVLLGNITCGESDTIQAAGTLIAINALALLVYAPSMGHAVFQTHSMLQPQHRAEDPPTNPPGKYISSEALEPTVEVHQKALDDLVNVNSLFTAAVFVGLAFANAGQQNIEGNKQCEAGVRVARRLVKNEVISFACYLFSSLVAKSLKTHLFTYLISDFSDMDRINDKTSKGLRGTLFALSTSTSVIGGVLLLYSMVDMIQLRLGKIACKGTETLNAAGALVAVNILAWVIYIPFVSHAICKSTMIFDELQKETPLSQKKEDPIKADSSPSASAPSASA